MQHPKILVLGHARHGKDTVCEILRDRYNFHFKSSSEFCCEKVIFDALKTKYDYTTSKECFDDRGNHRDEWFSLIQSYNAEDKARLGKEIFASSNVYCGLRNHEELQAMECEAVYDFSIWVDASKRLPCEASSSMTIASSMADYTIDNNRSLEDLHRNVECMMSHLGFAPSLHEGES